MRVRIATFNVENLDDVPGAAPSLQQRIQVMEPLLHRLRADIICFQEVHGQEQTGQKRQLLALQQMLAATPYAGYHLASTTTTQNEVYDKRNLVVASRFPILQTQQLRNNLIPKIRYQRATAVPPDSAAQDVSWERPILYVQLAIDNQQVLHLINLHLKSKAPVDIPGQKGSGRNSYMWRSSSAWAEGFFLSSMKRVGQAIETRLLIDTIFDADPNAMIAVCGDLNAEPDEVPVEALCGDVENTENPALNHRALVSCELSIPETARFTYLHKGRKRLLDHMLISRPLLRYYQHSEIHNETLHDESIAFATDVKFPESDHAPFIAAFDF